MFWKSFYEDDIQPEIQMAAGVLKISIFCFSPSNNDFLFFTEPKQILSLKQKNKTKSRTKTK